jgi:hypothetical protein
MRSKSKIGAARRAAARAAAGAPKAAWFARIRAPSAQSAAARARIARWWTWRFYIRERKDLRSGLPGGRRGP